MKKLLSFVIVFCLITFSISGQTKKYDISKEKIAENIYRINIGSVVMLAFFGEEGILLSDCGYTSTGEQIEQELNIFSIKPVKYIINTHWHHDHSGGNQYFKESIIIAHNDTRDILSRDFSSSFWQETYEAFPEGALPNITFNKNMTLNFSNEEIELLGFNTAHTMGDVIVYFKKSKVLHAGDLLFSFGFPALDVERGGNPCDLIDALKYIQNNFDKEILIVPGHGPNFNMNQLDEYIRMLEETYSIIKNNFDVGLSVKEMQDKKIIDDYSKWAEGYFSCSDWIEIVSESLKINGK